MNKIKLVSSAVAIALMSTASQNVFAERFTIQVDNNHKGVVKALAQKMGGKINIDSNGFLAATFDGKDLSQVKGLLNNPHIKLVEVDQPRKLLAVYADGLGDPMKTQITPYAVVQSEANQIAFDSTANMKVCVIDSGIGRDTDNDGSYHADFDWNNIDGTNDSGTGNWFEHGGPHGTHVAGTIAALDNGTGVIGMAPGVPLHIVKVFNASGWGYSSDLAHAANQCSDNGANIISMSLGGGGANSTEENAFNDFVASGGFVVAAAGNDGNSVRSYPAGYPSVMMIGANDANNNIAGFSQFPACETVTGRGRKQKIKQDETVCVEVTAGGVDTISTYPEGTASAANLAVDGQAVASSAMENSGSTGLASTYYMGIAETSDTGANGNICVIDRGNISFHDKVENCQSSGGIGAIIINNEAGMLYGTLGDYDENANIPTVGAALEDRASIITASTADIFIGASDYGFMSGTSMATPAVSGVAALVWSNHSLCTGSEIRAALKATAEDNGAAGNDVYFGYGIVKAAAADSYLTEHGCVGDGGGGPVDPPVGDFTLSADSYKTRGVKTVDLTWSGSAGNVDIWRDGNKVATNESGNSFSETLGKGGGSYSYKACETGTTTCAAEINVVF